MNETNVQLAGTQPTPKKSNGLRYLKKYPYIFALPFFLSYFVFSLFTIIFTLYLSFTDWNGFGDMQFVGLDNYKRMLFVDPRFFITLKNTFIIMIVTIPVTVLLSLFISFFLVQKVTKFKHFFRMANYLPAITAAVAVGLIWSLLFDWQFGSVNGVLTKLGFLNEPLNWLGEAWKSRIVLMIMLIWKGFGGTTILLSAALANVSEELIDAGKMDGASAIRSYLSISLPLVKPVLIFIMITSLISGFQLFDEPLLLFSGGFSGAQPYGGPERASLTMVMYLYEEAFTNFNFGYGSAISYGLFVVISIFSFVSLKLMTKGEKVI